ncbi:MULTISPECIES: antitoxin Xre/MbcA/ParS toxin-binding domain-containing protein [Pseudomonas]|uniref:Antitoxin Xre/MbcA/ParS-like toxin-binding domain-containing protein n=2 Tax=Pseudomonas TaxID=286 RepID=A0A3M3DR16_9PSED|nr:MULTISPECIES: antitoxin Xre/MbcA/ParS toxin-binding domain-containing protein [Pseudomonas]KPW89479.1 hypothetical protein ALO79_200142 [Pseudomonas syringae pv. castaneae]RMM39768.1 hypothetical protein ALQ77_03775 [Pseudomonas corrugata]
MENSISVEENLEQITRLAGQLFDGDLQAARKWMVSPVLGLGSKSPVDMLGTQVEIEAVFDLIGRLMHGVIT